jgi:hypothetical protein
MVMEWQNGGMGCGMADRHGQWPKLFKSNRVRRVAKAASCTFILCSFGTCFVNRKKVQSVTIPGTLYMRTQERCHRRQIYGQFKYLRNDRLTTINLLRHPMVSVMHEHNIRILTTEHGSFPWFSRFLPAEWWNGGMAEWRNGGMAEWRNGGIAEWRSGGVVEWRNGKRNGGMVEWQTKCLPSLVLTTLFPPV